MPHGATSLAPQSRRRLRWIGGALAGGLLVVAGACLAARSGGGSSWRNPWARWLPDLFPPEVTVCYAGPGFRLNVPVVAKTARQGDAAKSGVSKKAVAALSVGAP